MFEIDENNIPFVRTRQALLLLDLQNDFIGHGSLLQVNNPPDFLENIRNLVERFRPSGDVIWVRSVFPEGESRIFNESRSDSENIITNNELPKRRQHSVQSGLHVEHDGKLQEENTELTGPVDDLFEAHLTVDPGEKPCMVRASSPGSDFADTLLSFISTKDMVFDKSYYSAFRDGSLVQTLRGKFVTEIYICGLLTNVSVFATAMDAARHGYAITIVEDCLGYRSKARHDEALRQLKVYTGCDVTSSIDMIESCQKQKKTSKRTTSSKKSRPKPREPKPEPSRNTGIENLMGNLKLEAEDPQVDSRAAESDDEFELTVQQLRAQVRRAKPPGESAAEVKRERVRTKVKSRRRPSNSTTSDSRPSQNPTSSTPTQDSPRKAPQALGTKARIAPSDKSNSAGKRHAKDPSASGTPKDCSKEKAALNEVAGICEGDTSVVENFLPEELASGIFEKVRNEVLWQRMGHQGGEVPRLVAVQGLVDEDGSIPVYRHPADESPPLLAFSSTVMKIASEVEKQLGHSVNHALIQFYRDGNDNISEHSDKTLDIAHNTYIANVSLGAQRTMVFRTKKTLEPSTEDSTQRETYRAPLLHNSLCRMGQKTNMKWLHGIRPDKRMKCEKSEAELAYDCGRISLTFRRIDTFLDKAQGKIWGQGATAKSKKDAKAVINGDTPESKDMLHAFGKENHDSNFDWQMSYGKGFDVLHISNDKKLFLSGEYSDDMRVKFILNERNVPWAEGIPSSAFKWKDTSPNADLPPTREVIPIRFIDNDTIRTTVEGCTAIMLYIDAVYGPPQANKSSAYLALQYTRFEQSNTLLNIWRSVPFSAKAFRAELARWEAYIVAAKSKYIAGDEVGLADFALFPVLEMVADRWEDGEGITELTQYWLRLARLDSVLKLFGKEEREAREKRIEMGLIQTELRALAKASQESEGSEEFVERLKEDENEKREHDGKEIEELVNGVSKL